MSQENEKPMVNEEVLTATIVPANSDNALQIFEKREEQPQVQVQPEENSNQNTQSENNVSRVNSVASTDVDKTAVFEKKKGKMIVLGSIDNEGHQAVSKNNKTRMRSISPREGRKSSPRHQRSLETPQTVQSEQTEPFKVREPSESLMKSTAARVRDLQVLEERKKGTYNSPPKRKSVENSWTPSESLLRPTQARIMDGKEWEAHKERSKYEDDIWWELRKPAETAKPKPNTPSKLFEKTASFSKTIRPKYDPQAAAPATPPKEVHHLPPKINNDSPLLKATTAAKMQSWKQTEIVPEQPKPVLHLYSNQSGPQQVQSKLCYDTKAAALNRWKSKEQLEKEAAEKVSPNPNGKKVKGVSPRLLELNESLKYSVKPKYEKTNVDPREVGWTTVRRTSIPTIEEMHDTLVRSSGSIVFSQRDSSGSALTSQEYDEEGHRHIAPEETEDGHHHHDVEEQHFEEHQTYPQEDPEVESEQIHEQTEILPEEDPIQHEEYEPHTASLDEVTADLTQSVQGLEVH